MKVAINLISTLLKNFIIIHFISFIFSYQKPFNSDNCNDCSPIKCRKRFITFISAVSNQFVSAVSNLCRFLYLRLVFVNRIIRYTLDYGCIFSCCITLSNYSFSFKVAINLISTLLKNFILIHFISFIFSYQKPFNSDNCNGCSPIKCRKRFITFISAVSNQFVSAVSNLCRLFVFAVNFCELYYPLYFRLWLHY